MPSAPEISVVIVNYNAGRARLAKCLRHLEAQSFRDFETILVDNASADGSLAAVEDVDLPVRVMAQTDNLGFARGNNIAVAESRARWIALLNPDAFADPDWLQALMEAAGRYPGAGAFGSTQIDANDPARLDGAGDAYHISGLAYRGHFGWPSTDIPPEGETFAPCGAATFIRRDLFDRLGGFDERFFCYHEDVDLGFRLRLSGYPVIQAAAARVAHEGSALTGRRSAFAVYHGARNRIWTYLKNMPTLALWGFLPLLIAANLAALARSTMTGVAGPTMRGISDGIRGAGPFLRERRALHRDRSVSLWRILQAMTWSPMKMLRREAVLRPISTEAYGRRRAP